MKTELYTGPIGTAHPDVVAVELNWNERWANAPTFTFVLINHTMPKTETFVFEQRGRVFLGKNEDGWFRQLCHSGDDSNNGGYGGSAFKCRMEDGTEKVLHGPWSGRPANAHEMGWDAMQDVTVREEARKFGLIGGFYLSVPQVAATIRKFHPELMLFEGGEGAIEIAKPQWGATKEERQAELRDHGLNPYEACYF